MYFISLKIIYSGLICTWKLKTNFFLTDQRITCRLREGGDTELTDNGRSCKSNQTRFCEEKGSVVKVFQA